MVCEEDKLYKGVQRVSKNEGKKMNFFPVGIWLFFSYIPKFWKFLLVIRSISFNLLLWGEGGKIVLSRARSDSPRARVYQSHWLLLPNNVFDMTQRGWAIWQIPKLLVFKYTDISLILLFHKVSFAFSSIG